MTARNETSTTWMTVAQVADSAAFRQPDTTVYVVADNGNKLLIDSVEVGSKGWYSIFIVGDSTGEPLKRRAGFLLAVEVKAQISTNDKILDRVKALFAKADVANNDNAHERGQAYAMAMKLVAKHNIDMRAAMAGGSAEPIDMMTFNAWEVNKFELKSWRYTVMVAVTKLVPVRVLQYGTNQAKWVGTSQNMTIAMFIYQSICNQILAMVEGEAKAAKSRGDIAVGEGSKGKDPYAWRKQFLEGSAFRVQQRAVEIAKLAEQATSAIVLVMHGEVDSWLAANIKTGTGKQGCLVSGAGVAAGLNAGDSINLNTGLEADSEGQAPLLD